jgi:glycosyltransferase involved in cell wall biosynthesis
MNVSIVFSTYKNEDILEKTLEAYAHIVTAHSWQLVVVDNHGSQRTAAVAAQYSSRLPLELLLYTQSGKNGALNHALPHLKGELVFFTDNDVLPSRDLVDLLVDKAKKYSNYYIFTGRITPDIELPAYLDQGNPRIRAAFGILYKGEQDREVFAEEVWGGCMIVRRAILDAGYSFNELVGPHGVDYVMGGETELLLRLDDAGYKALYLADLQVYHQIRSEQLSLRWLRKRAWRSGRGRKFNSGGQREVIRIAGVPRYLIRQLIKDCVALLISYLSLSRKKIVTANMELWYRLGQIRQART